MRTNARTRAPYFFASPSNLPGGRLEQQRLRCRSSRRTPVSTSQEPQNLNANPSKISKFRSGALPLHLRTPFHRFGSISQQSRPHPDAFSAKTEDRHSPPLSIPPGGSTLPPPVYPLGAQNCMKNHSKSQIFDRAPYLSMRPTTEQLQNIVPSHPDPPSNALRVDTVHRGRFLEGGFRKSVRGSMGGMPILGRKNLEKHIFFCIFLIRFFSKICLLFFFGGLPD